MTLRAFHGRSFRAFLGIGAASAALAAPLAPFSLAQTPPATDPPKKPERPVQPGKVDIWTESRDVLERELEVVRALKSIRGTALTLWEHATDAASPFKQELTLDYALQKPDRLFIETKDLKVFADGKSITVYSKYLKHFVQRPMPEIWLLRDTIEQMSGGQLRSIPGEAILRPGMTVEQTLRGVLSVERASVGDYEGRPGTYVTGLEIDERQPGSIPYKFERWYSDSDRLCHLIKRDMTEMYQDLADRAAAESSDAEGAHQKPAKYLRVGATITYKRELDPALPADTFEFKPAPDDRLVDSFIWSRPNLKQQMALLGKPAPAVVGQDFGALEKDGTLSPPRDVDLARFKGKIVLLDFWATWCGPCVAGLPAMQAIKDKYPDRLVIIGVNEEGLQGAKAASANPALKVNRFLARRGITIQQFDDADQKVAKAYGVSGSGGSSIPVLVIIDEQGNVADIDSGYFPGKEKELIAKLDQMFAGKPLRTPEELRKLQEQVGTMN
jgi:thiol-disulfide isomerase/thioredoxin